MRLAFLIGELSQQSGQTQMLMETAIYLKKSLPDLECTIFTSVIIGEIPLKLVQTDVKIRYVSRSFILFFISKNLTEELKHFDMVYITGLYQYVFSAARSKKPVLYVAHHLGSPKLFKNPITRLKTLFSTWMFPLVVHRTTVLITVTEELGRFYEAKFKVKPVIIENIISDKYILEKSRGNLTFCDDRPIRLLSVGYWDGFDGRKRQDILIKIISELIRKGYKLRLTLVGLFAANINSLKNVATDLSITDNITFKTYLTEDELLNEYINNDVYVTATRDEGFYRQIVEAFGTGMPGLVFDSRDVVDGDSNAASANHVLKAKAGVLFRDAKSFEIGLSNIVKNYMIYSSNAIVYAKNYSSDSIGKKMMNTITLLNKKTVESPLN